MKERFIQNYVDKITKEDIRAFANKNGIMLSDNEIAILYPILKKEWKAFLYSDPTPILNDLKTKLSSTTYEKGIELYLVMKEKYQSLL